MDNYPTLMSLVSADRPEWLHLLSRLEEILGGPVVLAGGALRDLVLDRGVKDLDVFAFSASEQDAADKVNKVERAHLGNVGQFLHGEQYMDWAKDTLTGIAEFTLEGEFEHLPKLNLIFTKEAPTVKAMVDRMDFGICQVGITVREEYQTPEFFQDVQRNTFTFLKGADQWARSERRWKRLREKYPTFTLVGEPTAEALSAVLFDLA